MFVNIINILNSRFEDLKDELKWGNLDKHYHPEPNNHCYSVIHKGDEYQFHDDVLTYVEIRNFARLRELYAGLPLSGTIEENIQCFVDIGAKWEVYGRYCNEHYMVLKIDNYIFYEYEYCDEAKQFILEVIRLSAID